ncbi:heme exporter protein CcmD [Allohahella sp. A8]|uniref:heme exporter protein CcmD n=1 Tax=Allohahella sp. A8 TaxID=3141461 RepID=UPI000C09D405|nr:heme exporter protein CcmD [Hahellaceae bacterium]|tara:strand:- start:17509 stop:17766 length:258 start_codon:yes stop_codon:yes gene_type:complete
MTFAFDSLEAFFAMGKHGFYVWLAYGVGFAVILINILLAKRQRDQAFEQVRRLVRLENPSAAAPASASRDTRQKSPDDIESSGMS